MFQNIVKGDYTMIKQVENGSLEAATTIRKDDRSAIVPLNDLKEITDEDNNISYQFTSYLLTRQEYDTLKIFAKSKIDLAFAEDSVEQLIIARIRELE